MTGRDDFAAERDVRHDVRKYGIEPKHLDALQRFLQGCGYVATVPDRKQPQADVRRVDGLSVPFARSAE